MGRYIDPETGEIFTDEDLAGLEEDFEIAAPQEPVFEEPQEIEAPPIPEEDEGPSFLRRALLNTSIGGSDLISGVLGLSKRGVEALGGETPGIDNMLDAVDFQRKQDLGELGETNIVEDTYRGLLPMVSNPIGGGGVKTLVAKQAAREYGRKYDELLQQGAETENARTGATLNAAGEALASIPIFQASKSGLPALKRYANAIAGGATGGAVGAAADMAGTSVGLDKKFTAEEFGSNLLRGTATGGAMGAGYTGVMHGLDTLQTRVKAIKDYTEVKKFQDIIAQEGSDTPEILPPEPKPELIVPEPLPEPQPTTKTLDVDVTKQTKTFEAPIAERVASEGVEVIPPKKSSLLELPGKALKAAAEIPGYLKSRMTGEVVDDRPPVEKFLAADNLPEVIGKPLSSFRKGFTFLTTLADKGSPEAKSAVEVTRKLSQDQSSIIYDMRETLDPYYRLPDKTNVDRALAAERLSKKALPNRYVTNDTLTKMGLSPEEISAYRSVRGAMDKSLSLLEETLLNEGAQITKEVDNPNDPTADSPGTRYERAVKAYVDDLRSQGYVPFSRYGDGYEVRVQDGENTLYYDRFDDKRKAVLAAKALSKQYGQRVIPEKIGRVDDSAYDMFGPDLSGALKDFDPSKWTDRAKGKEPKGFSKHLVRAELIPGFEVDLARPISDYVMGLANFVSHKKAQGAFKEIINSLPEGSQTRGFIQRHVDDLRKPSSGTQKVINFLNTYYLAGVPSSALTNLTQTTTTTFPEFIKQLKGKGGIVKATGVLGDASLKAGQYMSTALTGKLEAFSKANPDLAKMLKDFERRGIVDAKATQDLIGYKNNLTNEAPLGQKLMLMFGGAESFNRLTAAIGGYEIAKVRGLEGEAAYKFAEDLVYRTQFDQTKYNRPEIARSPLGRTAFQFKLFTGNYLRFLRNNMASGDFKAVGASLGAMATWGGVIGIPLAKEVESIANSMGLDIRSEFKKLFGDSRTAAAVMYGLPTLAGANISGSAGTAEIFQGLDKSPDAAVAKAFLGTGYDLIGNKVPKAIEQGKREGSYGKALATETLLPRFLRNPTKASRALAMGGLKNVDPTTTFPILPDPTMGEATMLGLGVPPQRMINAYDGNNALYLEQQKQNSATGDFNKDIARALATQDAKLLKKVLADMAKQGKEDPTLKVGPNATAIKEYLEKYQDPFAARVKGAPERSRGKVMEILKLYSNP